MLEVGGRRCVVVGGGPVGVKRARALHAAGAEVVVVSPTGSDALDRLVQSGVVWWERVFESADLDGAWLVVVATGEPAVNEAVAAEAGVRGVLVNRADDAGEGGLTFMARGEVEGVTVAVDSGGASASAAGRLRDLAVAGVGTDWPRLVGLARPWRARVKAEVSDPQRRAEALRQLTGQGAMDILRAQGETGLRAYWTGLLERL